MLHGFKIRDRISQLSPSASMEGTKMSFMFEVYYGRPADVPKEATLTAKVSSLGGRLTYREVPEKDELGGICLIYEFDDLNQAELAAKILREQGEHIEGPMDYGD